MFCKVCGKEVNDQAYVCPYCGAKLANDPAPAPQQSASNGMAIAGLICAFFVPLLGLIFGCIGLSKSKEMNGEGKGMSIAAIVISVLWFALAIIIVVATFGTAAAVVNQTANSAFLPF